MPKCILSGQVKSTFTQEQADGRYIQMTNGATTTLATSLQVSGINNIEFTEEGEVPITASNVSYSNTTSGMTSGNVQNAIDELFQSVSDGAGGLRVVAQGTEMITGQEISLPSPALVAFVWIQSAETQVAIRGKSTAIDGDVLPIITSNGMSIFLSARVLVDEEVDYVVLG